MKRLNLKHFIERTEQQTEKTRLQKEIYYCLEQVKRGITCDRVALRFQAYLPGFDGYQFYYDAIDLLRHKNHNQKPTKP